MSLDLVPFQEISAAAVAALAIVYFLAFFIRGIIGFGSSMPAVLGSVWILDPHEAVVIALMCSVFAQIQLLPQGFRDANWKITRPMLAGMLVAVIVGVSIFAILDAAWLTIVIGLVLVFAVLTDLTKLADRAAGRLALDRFAVAFSLGALAGLVAGVAGAGANYMLSVYIRWAAPTPRAFRATNIMISGCIGLWRAVVTALSGFITLKLVAGSIVVMPAVFAGGWAGRKLAGRLSRERYFRVFQIFLLLASVSLIGKGLANLP